MESWGYKFEDYILSDSIHESDEKNEFDNQQVFYSLSFITHKDYYLKNQFK